MVKVLVFIFLLCLVFQSGKADVCSFYQDDPQPLITPGKADAAISQKRKNEFYRIQVKAEPSLTTDLRALEKQCHQTNLVIEKHDGLFKYLSEPITNYNEAIRQLRLVHAYQGFKNSFIVSYRNGFRIDADGSQSTVQYLEKEKKVDLKKVSVNKPVNKPRAVGSKNTVNAKSIKERIWNVMSMPFKQYNQCEILSILSLLLLNFTIIVGLLLIHYLYVKRRGGHHQKLKELYAECLAGFVFDKSTDPSIPMSLLKVNTRFQKDLLIQEMMSIIHNMGNGAEERMMMLYYKLELQHHSIYKLNSRKWFLKIAAMHELAIFKVSEVADSVAAYIDHKNQILKQEALRCMVRLKPHHPFETLLDHEDEAIREHVIRAIGEMHLTQYSEALMMSFNKEQRKIQLVILDTMCKLADTLLLNFLSDIVLKNNDMEIRLKAATALVNIGSLGLTRMEVLLLNQDKDIAAIYKQVTDKPTKSE